MSSKTAFFLYAAFALLMLHCEDDTATGPANTGDGLRIFAATVESDYHGQVFDPATASVGDTAVVRYDELLWYDTARHVMGLSVSRDSVIQRLGGVGVRGVPFVITLDNDRIYGGYFWTSLSSFSSEAIVIMADSELDTLGSNEMRIRLGYPSADHFAGEDLRNAPALVARLGADGKIG